VIIAMRIHFTKRMRKEVKATDAHFIQQFSYTLKFGANEQESTTTTREVN